MALNTRNIEIEGLPVRYHEAGSRQGAPIIFLHGAVGDALFHWERLMFELEAEYHLLAPDLPGFGETALLPEMTYEALVTWVKQFYVAVGIRDAVLVGNSLGGLIARLLASESSKMVPALILINGGVLPGKPAAIPKLLANVPYVGDWLFETISKGGIKDREALEWLVTDPSNKDILTDKMVQAAADSAPALSAVMRMQIQSPVPQLRVPMVPTLLLWGAQDTFSPVSAGEKVHKSIPGSKFRK
ncbi:MAG: alpha/beta hydrolase, partial [Chloroflexota bacterium]